MNEACAVVALSAARPEAALAGQLQGNDHPGEHARFVDLEVAWLDARAWEAAGVDMLSMLCTKDCLGVESGRGDVVCVASKHERRRDLLCRAAGATEAGRPDGCDAGGRGKDNTVLANAVLTMMVFETFQTKASATPITTALVWTVSKTIIVSRAFASIVLPLPPASQPSGLPASARRSHGEGAWIRSARVRAHTGMRPLTTYRRVGYAAGG